MRAGGIFLARNGPQNHPVMVVKITSSTRPKIEAVYFCIVLALVKIHAGGNQERMRNDKLIWSGLI